MRKRHALGPVFHLTIANRIGVIGAGNVQFMKHSVLPQNVAGSNKNRWGSDPIDRKLKKMDYGQAQK